MRKTFFDELRPLEDDIMRNMAEGRPAGMTLDDYAARAVTALDSIIGSLRTISDAARAHTDAACAAARGRVLADGAVIFVSALMVGLCGLVIARRMTSPLNGIVTRIDSLMSSSIDFQRHQGKDEFSLVSYTLDVLEQSMAERERDASALAEANDKLAELAVTDELTGIFNRRRFNERLALEWARARRDVQPLAVLMIDIDHFKMYNDRYGHQAGDACLVDVAQAMNDNLRRPGDMAARYGGEEFVVISAGSTPAQGRQLAERIRRAVAALALPHADSPYARVTVSIGVSAVTPGGSLLAHYAVSLADDALYKAKKAGRNRVVLAAFPGE